MRGWACVSALAFCSTGILAAEQVDVQQLINTSVSAERNDFLAQPQYDYTVVERDGGGPAKTFRQTMIDGSPYRELIAVNGDPLPPVQRQKEARKLQDEIARRKNETPQEREDRIAKYKRNRDQEHTMLNQMVKAFDYKLAGEGTLDGHAVYILQATPRPSYQPPNTKAKVLTGMRGKLWLDKATAHWVKVEAEVVTPVEFYGFLAKVGPGTRFELEKAPVAGNVWMPAHFAMNVNAKILGLFSHNQSEQDRFFNYQLAAGPRAVNTDVGNVSRPDVSTAKSALPAKH
jgi:hypothetical protein